MKFQFDPNQDYQLKLNTSVITGLDFPQLNKPAGK